MVPRLVHARKAKLMSGMINKTDKGRTWVEPVAAHRNTADGVDSLSRGFGISVIFRAHAW
jgi:hypothetical protein